MVRIIACVLLAASLVFACGGDDETSTSTDGTSKGESSRNEPSESGSSSGGSSSGGSSSGGSSSGGSSSGGSSSGGQQCSPTGGGCSFSIECCSNSCNQGKGVCL